MDKVRWENVVKDKGEKIVVRFLVSLLAFFIFICSLFIYPPTSLFVFVFTFSIMIFSSIKDWPQTRWIIIRDVLFFGFGLLMYRMLDRLVVNPWLYSSGITTDVVSKIPLIGQTFLLSLSGIWDLVMGIHGGLVWGGIFVLCTFVWFVSQRDIQYLTKHYLIFILQKFLVMVFIFFLVNIPAFLAEGCFSVPGYRVLLSSTALFIIFCRGSKPNISVKPIAIFDHFIKIN